MAKLIVAFGEEMQRERITAALESSGQKVSMHCRSGAEVIRTLHTYQDCVLICAPLLPDCTADMLTENAGEDTLILVAGKPERLSLCESPRLFRLTWPFARTELVSTVNMLLQLHDMRRPQRLGDERKLIDSAKLLLMRDQNISEPQAHRLLQRASMDLGIPMVESARRILNGDGLR